MSITIKTPDEIVQRLRHYKDFNELKKEIEKEDANNDLVIEILSQGVSMINESDTKVSKEKIRGKEPGTSAKDVVKPSKHSVGDDNKSDAKSSIATPYIVKGDGQITIKVVTPEKRDAFLAKNHNINEAKAIIGDESDGASQDDELVKSDKTDDSKDTDKKKKRREEQRSNAVPPSANGVSIPVIKVWKAG